MEQNLQLQNISLVVKIRIKYDQEQYLGLKPISSASGVLRADIPPEVLQVLFLGDMHYDHSVVVIKYL